ncbi:MAG: hypothetical protein A2Y10_19435 [Planctomycetes bacterium GWF2_41_51]|nr:MAG: hypothetical protein A2Y10_19435 [Planctomycetes bacterium GWF2_41_51]
MKWPTPINLRQFVDSNIYPSISLYMPTHIHGEQVRQDPIRFKNMITETREILKQKYPEEKAEEFLTPAYDLLKNSIFWQHQSNGLAMFITPELSQYLHLSVKPQVSVYVGNFLNILPLVPSFIDEGTFYLLVLSQHRVQLFEAAHYTKTEIELPGIFKTIEEMLRFDIAEDNVMARAMPPGSISGKGAMYYGSADLKLGKRNTERFVQTVAAAVDKKLFNNNAPLIIAAVEYIEAMFRMHCSYPHLVSKGIHGNPDQINVDSLHNQAWDIISDYLKKDEEKYTALYNDFSNTDKTSTDINAILPSAYMGRADTLFVDANKHLYGKFDPQSLKVEIHERCKEGDEDLLNLAAIYALKTDGRIFPANKKLMKTNEPMVAIFRY